MNIEFFIEAVCDLILEKGADVNARAGYSVVRSNQLRGRLQAVWPCYLIKGDVNARADITAIRFKQLQL